jgi:hypothetical protein
MTGLKDFEIEQLNFHPETRTITYTFTVTVANMDGLHITRGTLLGLGVVNGQGPMRGTMNNSKYRGTVYWQTEPVTDYIIIKDHIVNVEIMNMEMQLLGFGSAAMDTIVNNQIRNQIPDMITSPEFQQQMNDMLDGIMKPLFQAIAYQKTPITIHDYLAERAANPAPPQC